MDSDAVARQEFCIYVLSTALGIRDRWEHTTINYSYDTPTPDSTCQDLRYPTLKAFAAGALPRARYRELTDFGKIPVHDFYLTTSSRLRTLHLSMYGMFNFVLPAENNGLDMLSQVTLWCGVDGYRSVCATDIYCFLASSPGILFFDVLCRVAVIADNVLLAPTSLTLPNLHTLFLTSFH